MMSKTLPFPFRRAECFIWKHSINLHKNNQLTKTFFGYVKVLKAFFKHETMDVYVFA